MNMRAMPAVTYVPRASHAGRVKGNRPDQWYSTFFLRVTPGVISLHFVLLELLYIKVLQSIIYIQNTNKKELGGI
jgi:hypothetical protein